MTLCVWFQVLFYATVLKVYPVLTISKLPCLKDRCKTMFSSLLHQQGSPWNKSSLISLSGVERKHSWVSPPPFLTQTFKLKCYTAAVYVCSIRHTNCVEPYCFFIFSLLWSSCFLAWQCCSICLYTTNKTKAAFPFPSPGLWPPLEQEIPHHVLSQLTLSFLSVV